MATNLSTAGYSALQSLGLENPYTIDIRQPFAMIGKKKW